MLSGDIHISSLLVTQQVAQRNALNYLFSVVLRHGFEAVETVAGAKARLSLGKGPAVVLVDLSNEPDLGIDLVGYASSMSARPVVIALHDHTPDAAVRAFIAGADDVVDWPCNLQELAARLFKRLGLPLDQRSLPAGDVSWETEAYIAERAGLTTSEAQVMRVLYTHDGEIVSRDDLSMAVDARPWRYGDRKFDVHVAKIRKKLSDSFGDRFSVSTIRSSGYRMVSEVSDVFNQR